MYVFLIIFWTTDSGFSPLVFSGIPEKPRLSRSVRIEKSYRDFSLAVCWSTVEHVYFARIYCSRMTNQSFVSMYFSRMGEKQWRQKTSNTRKTPTIHEKGPKTVKIINIEMFVIKMFFANGIQIVKIAKNRCAQKSTLYSIVFLLRVDLVLSDFSSLSCVITLSCKC